MVYYSMNFKGEHRFDAALVADAGANPASSKFARVIEGHSGDIPACSDLSPSSILSGGVEADPNSRNCFGSASNPLVVLGHAQRMTNTSLKTAIDIAGVAPRPLNFFHVPVLDEVFGKSRLGNPDERVSVEKRGRAIATGILSWSQTVAAWKNFCQSVLNTPMNVGEPWATIGRTADALFSRSLTHCVRDLCRLSGARFPNGLMRVFHGASIPSTLFLAGAGWATCGSYAHARRVVVAQRPPSATLGAGQTRLNRVVYGGIKGLL